MKRILTMALSLVLLATLAIGGTVAYLTDTEKETNVFEIGKVDIELIEQQRDPKEEGSNVKDNGDLIRFEQNRILLPIVGSAQGEKDDWGLVKTSAARNYEDKIVRVKNVGKTDAYVRIFVAIPKALEDEVGPAGNALHWNVGNRFDPEQKGRYNTADTNSPFRTEFCTTEFRNGFEERGVQNINGIDYNVYCFTRVEPLKAGDTSAAAFVGFYLDKNVDYNDEDGCYYLGDAKIDYDLDNGVYIPVFAEAVQYGGFEGDSDDAFSAAIEGAFNAANTDSSKKYNPWWNGKADIPTSFVTVSSYNDLTQAFTEAAVSGKKVKITLEENIEMESTLTLAENANVVLNMNGKTMSLQDNATGCDPMFDTKAGSSLTIDGNGTFDLGNNSGHTFIVPRGDITINSGTFKINTDLSDYGCFFLGAGTGGKLIINGGYFDGGYYNANNCYMNCYTLLNLTNNQYVRVYGGTFVGQNLLWGDEGSYCPHRDDPEHSPHTWGTKDQGFFLEGQTDGTLPAGYTITEGTTADGRPTYTVSYTRP